MKYTNWFKNTNKFQAHEQWIFDNLLYETILGSHAYGCERSDSDYDILAIVIPPREMLFPSEYDFIIGFDQLPTFKRKELKGAEKRVIIDNKTIEIEWISLVEFFYQCAIKGSPNLIEALFTRQNLVTYTSQYADILRSNRKLFLSIRTYHAFRGYSYSQLHRIKNRDYISAERLEIINNFGYDVKMASHVFRLLDQIIQILTIGDIDLMRTKDEQKCIKAGEWGSFDQFEREYYKRMSNIDELVTKCSLSLAPRTDELRKILKECIYLFYSKNQINHEYIRTNDIYSILNNINNNITFLKDKLC